MVSSPCVNDGLAVAFTHAVLLGRSSGDTEGVRVLRGDAVRAGLSQTLGGSGGGCPPAVPPPRRALAARGSWSLCGAGSCSFRWSRTFPGRGSPAFPGGAGAAPWTPARAAGCGWGAREPRAAASCRSGSARRRRREKGPSGFAFCSSLELPSKEPSLLVVDVGWALTFLSISGPIGIFGV